MDDDGKYAAVWSRKGGDTIRCVHELSARRDGHRRLSEFVDHKRGKELPLPWPKGWVFTFRARRADAALQRSVDPRELRSRLCCEPRLTVVGVVHDARKDSWRPENSVIVVGVGGTVYLYDRVDAVLFLAAPDGFGQLFEIGLRRVHCVWASVDEPSHRDGEKGDDEDEEDVRFWRLVKRVSSYEELLSLRKAFSGHHAALRQKDDSWAILRVCDPSGADVQPEDLRRWATEIPVAVLDVFFSAKMWTCDGWLVVVVLVSSDGEVFVVEPADKSVRFLARDLREFFSVGFMRFRNNFVFRRRGDPTRSSPVYGPSGCPRGSCEETKKLDACSALAFRLRKIRLF
uniref:Tegument protein UL43 n=1 Tax=Lemniscomys rat herpesvirus TaxID=3141920 RepID=A0AAU7E1H6_9VIRU